LRPLRTDAAKFRKARTFAGTLRRLAMTAKTGWRPADHGLRIGSSVPSAM
jgi:hypothetical protein